MMMEEFKGETDLTYEVSSFDGFVNDSIFFFVGKVQQGRKCKSCKTPPENSTDLVAY
jgi:hypothetical protein